MAALNEARKEEVLQYWVNNPTLPYEQIYKNCNIGKKTFWMLRKDQAFMDRYHQLCQQRFAGLEAKAVAKLEEQVDEGNFSAVKYVLDGQGYAAAQKIDLETNVIKVSLTDD